MRNNTKHNFLWEHEKGNFKFHWNLENTGKIVMPEISFCETWSFWSLFSRPPIRTFYASASAALCFRFRFMLPLEFDSNLCRYNFPDRYASAGIWFQIIFHWLRLQRISDAYQMLVWKLYGFYSTGTDVSSVWRYVYIITNCNFYLGYLSSLSRPSNGI